MCYSFQPNKTANDYLDIICEGNRLLDEEIYAQENLEYDIDRALVMNESITEFGKKHVRDLITIINMLENRHEFWFGPAVGDKLVLADMSDFVGLFDEEYLIHRFGSVPVIGDLFRVVKIVVDNNTTFYGVVRDCDIGEVDQDFLCYLTMNVIEKHFSAFQQ